MKVRWGLVAIAGLVCVIAVIVSHLGSEVWQRSRFPRSQVWQVVRVSDGDTLKVQSGGKQETIRFCGIDAPELAQPLGKQSRDYLKRLVDKAGGRVIVQPVKRESPAGTLRERYGRLVSEVFVAAPTRQQPEQERLLDYEQVAAGMAYVYSRYVGECPNGKAIAQGERSAQSKRLGVWAGNYQRPWDYRKQQRQS